MNGAVALLVEHHKLIDDEKLTRRIGAIEAD
jgi:hypothetical protein